MKMTTITDIKYQLVSSLESLNLNLPLKRQVEVYETIKKILKKITRAIGNLESEDFSPSFHKVADLQRPAVENMIVGVNARVSEIGELDFITVEDADLLEKLNLKKRQVRAAEIALTDGDAQIKCLSICDLQLYEKIKSMCGERLRVIGIPLLIPIQKRVSKMQFLILNVELQKNTFEMLCPTKEEIQYTKNWVEEKSSMTKSLVNILEVRILKALQIKLDEDNIMRRVVRFAILMALSGGKSENILLCIHLLLIGRSGAGKKTITKVLEYLSPVFVQAHANRLSKAGLVGPANLKDGIWKITPGLLPQANDGCFSVQDAHAFEDMKAVANVFSMSMEDGEVMSSNATMSRSTTNTSILLDMNRKSHILGQEPENEIDDLFGLPLNVLTRFDGIVELPTNLDSQFKVADSILKSFDGKQSADFEHTKRQTKLIVAYVKDEFNEITIPVEVREYAADKWKEYFDSNREVFNEFPNLSDFNLRMTNSIIKLLIVTARANFRRKASVQDVDEALKYLKFKIRYLQKAASNLQSEALTNSIKNKPKSRAKLLNREFGGKTVKFSEVKKFCVENFKFREDAHPKKFYREIENLAQNNGKGEWTFN